MMADLDNILDLGATVGGDITIPILKALVNASGPGARVLIPAGTWTLSSTITPPAHIRSLTICGAGRGHTIIRSTIERAPAFDLGSTTFLDLCDFELRGNGAASGHGIRLADPDFGQGTFLPQHAVVRRLVVSGFTGTDRTHLSATPKMSACGIFGADLLQCTFSEVLSFDNNFGFYFMRPQTVKLDHCTVVNCPESGIVVQEGEAFNAIACDILESGRAGVPLSTVAPAALPGALSGGFVSVDTRGASLVGCKLKRSQNAQIVHHGYGPLGVTGNWIRSGGSPSSDGVRFRGTIQIIGNYFDPVFDVTFPARKEIFGDLSQASCKSFGMINGNEFSYGGGGTWDALIAIENLNFGFLQGTIRDNMFGRADQLANAVTITDAVRVTGQVNALTISSNMACVTPGVTITNMYNMVGVTTPHGEGLYLENNRETLANGTIVNDLVLPNAPERWRVLDENGLTVQ